MFKSMNMQVIVIEINAFCIDFSHQLSFWDSGGIRFSNYVLLCTLHAEICSEKYQNIELYVLSNSLAMCMDITETYDDMIGLRLLLYMCR